MKKNKYYFYNPETGCDWNEEMTVLKKERFLENRPWIQEKRPSYTSGVLDKHVPYAERTEIFPIERNDED